MGSLSRSSAVVELGKRIAAQLEDDGDITSAWLAHLIAERMEAARTAHADEKLAAETACTELILELWHHQRVLPGKGALAEFEPVLRTLGSLDIEPNAFRYYPSVLRAADGSKVPEAVDGWLKLATGMDYTARLMIKMALGEAVENLTDDAHEWIALARAAAAEDSLEGQIVRFLEIEEEAPGSNFSEARMDKIRRLEAFIQIATQIARDVSDEQGQSQSDG